MFPNSELNAILSERLAQWRDLPENGGLPAGAMPGQPLRFYLDTSVIRKLASRPEYIATLPAFTSALTLLELLDGSPTDYGPRASALSAILKSELSIAPQMPNVAAARAFTAIDIRRIVHTQAKVMILHVDRAMNLPQVEAEAALAADPEWQAIRRAYRDMADLSIQNAITVGRQLRREFSTSADDQLQRVGIDSALPPDARFEAFINGEVNRGATLLVLASRIAEGFGRGGDDSFEKEIFDSYNGGAEPYVKALSFTLLDRMRRGQVPAINDAYDLDHFAYLSPGDVLVTADKRMAAVAKHCGVTVVDLAGMDAMLTARDPNAP